MSWINTHAGREVIEQDIGSQKTENHLFNTLNPHTIETTDTKFHIKQTVNNDEGLIRETVVTDDPYIDKVTTTVDPFVDKDTHRYPQKRRQTDHPEIQTVANESRHDITETTTRVYKEGVSGGITIS